jgi:hypothetical protein
MGALMTVTQKFIVIGLWFLVTLATGFWRSKAGQAAFPGIHKLVALTWVVYTAIVIYHAGRPVEWRAALLAAIAVLAVAMAALIASGSLLTMPQYVNAVTLNAHRMAATVAAIAGGVTARLLLLRGR